jgi:flagellar basal-body rod protein FlgB
MLENVNILGLAMDRARHAAARQELTARNVANADTPGYKALDVSDFEAEMSVGFQTRRTHAAHQDFSQSTAHWREIEAEGAADPNGNTVSLDQEILRSVEAERAHDRAVTIYKSSLDLLRTSLGRK